MKEIVRWSVRPS